MIVIVKSLSIASTFAGGVKPVRYCMLSCGHQIRCVGDFAPQVGMHVTCDLPHGPRGDAVVLGDSPLGAWQGDKQ